MPCQRHTASKEFEPRQSDSEDHILHSCSITVSPEESDTWGKQFRADILVLDLQKWEEEVSGVELKEVRLVLGVKMGRVSITVGGARGHLYGL